MALALCTVRCPAGVSPQKRELTRGALSIGRGVECDWVLPDPERLLSKRHCLLARQDDMWLVTDLSRNGTFLNGNALDPGIPHALRAGDRFAFGAYEIEARLDNEVRQTETEAPRPPLPVGSEHGQDRLTSDPFAFPGLAQPVAAEPAIGLSPDFDPLAESERVAETPFVIPDHLSDLNGQFQPPRPSLELLPDDWDHDAPSPPPPMPLPPATPPPVTNGLGYGEGFRAFAEGAGIPGESRIDPRRALGELGAAFRATVSGLRRVMIARAAIKDEFRIERTMIRAAGNNPLKFAADDDDALAALLGIGRQGGMSAERAIADAMRDMRLHELAVANAMQQAVRDMLGQFAPDKLMRELPASAGDSLPGRRRQRAWSVFETLHARMLQKFNDDFDSLFGKSFMRAYEAALANLSSAEIENARSPLRMPGDRNDLE